jgi:excisionase family DNA binding protein
MSVSNKRSGACGCDCPHKSRIYLSPILATRIALTIDEAAEAFGLSRSKIYEHLHKGLRSRAVDSKRVILVDDLRDYIKNLPDASTRMEADRG